MNNILNHTFFIAFSNNEFNFYIPSMLTNQDQIFIYGLHSEGLVAMKVGGGVLLHPDVAEHFFSLKKNALDAGIDLEIASGFRNFDRQLLIWNRKASGQLNVLDRDGQPINMSRLTGIEKVFAILRWSALPGASRHHWGTDLDVFDARELSTDYQLQLTMDESQAMFSRLHCWLDKQIEQNMAMGFFRPYQIDRGGIAPEPWHLSYAPLAREFQREFSIDKLAQILVKTDIALKETILANLDEIYERFIQVPYSIYPAKRV